MVSKIPEKLKGKLCFLCGSEDELTLHHLRTPKMRTLKEREKLGIIINRGECIPVCRICHRKLEFVKKERDTLRELAKGLAKAKQAVSNLFNKEFEYVYGEREEK